MAAPSLARSGYVLRLATAEVGAGRSMLVADFGSGEVEQLAAASRTGRVVVASACERDHVFPVGGWHALPAASARPLQQWLASWLRPAGALGDARDVGEAIDTLAALPFVLRDSTLYGWRRFVLDPGFRGRVSQTLPRAGLDPRVLHGARPGTGLWRILRERVDHVLGHDDTIDRVFPAADLAALVEPSARPEVRCVLLGRGTPVVTRYQLLGWVQVLAALANLASPRRADPRALVSRLLVIDPPPDALALLEAMGGLPPHLGLNVVCRNADWVAPPERWIGERPALLVQRDLGAGVVGKAGLLEGREAERLVHGAAEGELLHVHQRGAPVRLWTNVRPVNRLPAPEPGALGRAMEEGRRRYTVPRREVVANRTRLEAQLERRARRLVTADLLDRALGADRLAEAWKRVRRNAGVPGVDGVTVEAFEPRWQHEVQQLAVQVRAGRYGPAPWLRVWRDKPGGGARPIGIPSVRDRVLMAAVADVLGEALDPTFSDRSFAYRPGRGARRAVAELAGGPGLADGWAIIADIASYFDTIDHRLLLAMLREHVDDEAAIRLVGRWITNPVRDAGRDQAVRRGVPQGSGVSPVLANLYLTPLDRWMERRGLAYARYADDFVAICPSEQAAAQVSADLEAFLARELRLSVKPTKTSFVCVREGFDFLGFRINAEGVSIAEKRVVQCRDSVAAALRAAAGVEHLRELDALVRGFRNYFDLPHPAIVAQLGTLEAARVELVEAWCREVRVDARAVAGRGERFILAPLEAESPRGYPDAEPPEAEADPEPAAPLAAAVSGSLAQVDRAPDAVRRRAASGRPTASMAAGHLSVYGYAVAVAAEGERLVVRRKREAVFEVPIAALRSVSVQTYGMALTTPLLETLARADVPVLFAHPGGKPWGALRGNVHRGSAELLAAQLAARGGPLAVAVTKALLGAKLTNQERLLRYYAKYRARRDGATGQRLRDAADAIVKLRDRVQSIEEADIPVARKKLFAAEGRAGAAYWGGIGEVLGEGFPGRTGKGAADPINVALNFGYGMLYAATWAAVMRAGLEPGVGMLHAAPGDRAALVFDLVEPFRVPAVDRPVIGFLGRGGTVKLNKDGHLSSGSRQRLARVVAGALEKAVTWGGAARPLAQHIDQHALDLAVWINGGRPLEAFRMRW